MAAVDNTLLSSLTGSPHNFLQPSFPLHTDTLAFLKHALDPLATDVATSQQQRQQEARKKRKRGENVDVGDVLRLKQVHTQGFGVDQIWEQARRVIDAARVEAESAVIERLAMAQGAEEDEEEDEGISDGYDMYDAEDGSSMGEEGVDYEVEGDDVGADEESDGDDEDMEDALDDPDAVDDFADEDMDVDGEGSDMGNGEPAEEFVADKHGLNDGFFSIDDFNKQSDFLEQQDFRGDGDGAASDEEDVDWDANPLSQAAAEGIAAEAGAADDGEEEDDEDGPTFGDPDAESEDDEDEVDAGEMNGVGGMGNTNDVMYQDFFAPPAQKKRKNKKGRPNPHNFPAQVPTIGDGNIEDAKEPEEDMQRTINKVHRDLFEDESEGEDDDDNADLEDLDPADPRSRRSAHERRKAALQEEIRKLEAANVAKREWTLQGEARAADRPMNSLLEEDLDFERAGKPVPVITAEVSESLEELIKRRILAHDFQDLIRRRPDDLATGGGKRGRLDYELDDTKSKKGLAEEYEEEHLRRTDPNFVDASDEKTRKEEAAISALWRDVSAKLDSLSSWHFRPKAPAPAMEIRTDAPVISMEDARPAAGGEVAGASQLAPQEVYKAGEGQNKGAEVVGTSGLPEGREEMDRDDKKRRRRRAKERGRKAAGSEGAGGAKTAVAEGKKPSGKEKNKEMLGDLKKGGVKVIGKKGEVQDVEGRDVRAGTGGQGAAQFKL
ncbi:hypothetical protein MBLNU230_g8170t1 [Neophaeotheca triangularis]